MELSKLMGCVKRPFIPSELFRGGLIDGAWFDPSDLSTLYQDAAGTTPVTAVEQPVGKMLDKSGNGYHATQPITASRPTLSARYNLLTTTEDITSSDWSTMGVVTRTKNYSTAPDGTLTSQRIVFSDTSNVNQFFLQRATAAANYAESVFIRATSGSGKIKLGVYDGQIKTNTCDLTEQWQLITYANLISAATSRLCWLYPDGVGFATDIQIWHPSAILGTTSGPYQRVNTATDYDTDERYFKKYLRFDGVDDFINLPFMNLYGGGSASIVCARDAVSQATDTYIISERSTTDADPKYFPSRQLANAGNMDTYITDDAGAVVLDTVGSQFSGVANAVIRSIVDSGNNLKLFKNGVLAANDNYTRSGTLTLNNTTIGASASTTTSNYASMKVYGLIVTKSALTDSQRIACERHLGRKSGVQL